MLLGFGAFLRKSELAALKRSDIAVGADGVVSVRIRQSKTDQLKRGVTVLVNGKIAGVSVVAAVDDLLGRHDRAGLGSEDAIFRSTEGPTAGRAAAKDALVRAFKRRVMAASKRFSLGLKAEDMRAIACGEAGCSWRTAWESPGRCSSVTGGGARMRLTHIWTRRRMRTRSG